jgi:hypothetical protein
MAYYKETVTLAAGQLVTESASVAPGAGLVRVSTPAMTGTPTFTIQGSVDDGITNLDNYVGNTVPSYNLASTPRTIALDPNGTKGLDTLRLKVSASEATVKTFELVFST